MSTPKDKTELLNVFSDALMEHTNAKVQLHTDWDFDQLIAVLANPHIALAAYQQLRGKTRSTTPARSFGRTVYEHCPDCFTALLVPDTRPEAHYLLRCSDQCGFWCPDIDRVPFFACDSCSSQRMKLFTTPIRVGTREPFHWTTHCEDCGKQTMRQPPAEVPPQAVPPLHVGTFARVADRLRSLERHSFNSVVQYGVPYTAPVGAPTLRYHNAEDGLRLEFQLTCRACGGSNTSLSRDFNVHCHSCNQIGTLRAFGRITGRTGIDRALQHRNECESNEVIGEVNPRGSVSVRCVNCSRSPHLRNRIQLETNSDGIRLRDPLRGYAHQQDLVFDSGATLPDDAPFTGLAPEQAVYEEFTAVPGRFYSDPQMDITASLNVETCTVCRGRCYLLQSGEKACLNCGRTALIDGTGFKTRLPRELDTDRHTHACTSSELTVQVHPASQGVALAHFDCRGCGATVNSAGRIALQLVREGTSQRWSLAAIGRGPSVGQL